MRETADRAVRGAFCCGMTAIVLLLITIVLEIVRDISSYIPFVFAAYTTLSVLFCCIAPKKQKKEKETFKTVIFVFGIMEIMFIIPYSVIILIESII